MREDDASEAVRSSEVWKHQRYELLVTQSPEKFTFDNDDPRNRNALVTNSLSGNERNRLFMRTKKNFVDVSLVSGLDITADGRSFALVDYDQDGWVDIALTSLNVPRFKLFKNRIGEFCPDNKVLRIKLIGSKTDSKPNETEKPQTNRDAVGAKVFATFQSGISTILQRQTGEGYSAQNSEVLRVGSSKDDPLVQVKVIWPTGESEIIKDLNLDELLVVHEQVDN